MPETKTIISKIGKILHILFIDSSKTKTRVSFLTNKEVKIVFVSNPWHPKSVVPFPVFCWHLDRVLPCHDDFFGILIASFRFPPIPVMKTRGEGSKKLKNKSLNLCCRKKTRRQRKTVKNRKRQKKKTEKEQK